MDPLTDAPPASGTKAAAWQQVTALYQAHALGLVRLAKIMLGEQSAAEDAVQEAFIGLYRRWPLREPDRALGYLRTSVLNACRVIHVAATAATVREVRPSPGRTRHRTRYSGRRGSGARGAAG